MFFAEDELHCDIFALVLFIQWIFVGSCELENISHELFFSSNIGVVVGSFCLLYLEILGSDSTYVSSMAF